MALGAFSVSGVNAERMIAVAQDSHRFGLRLERIAKSLTVR